MLGNNIKNFRKAKGYSQETLAQELNVVRQTVSKWEKGYSVPDAVMLERMAELFDVSVGELLGAEETKDESRPELGRISDQLSVLNNQIAIELSRRRKVRKTVFRIFVFLLFLIFVLIIIGLIPLRNRAPSEEQVEDDEITYSVEIKDSLNEAIAAAIIKENSGKFLEGDCPTESHLVYGTESKNGTIFVYLYEDFAWYGFDGGEFKELSGKSGPAVYTFAQAGNGYVFLDCREPADGGEYASSIKEMFPGSIAKAILRGPSEEEKEALLESREQQAAAYLEAKKG